MLLNEDVSPEIIKSVQKENQKKKKITHYDEPYIADKKPGRNDPCPCGSGKKYKKCCGKRA